jgi:hypothetical protein
MPVICSSTVPIITTLTHCPDSRSALGSLHSTRKCRPRMRTTSLTTRHPLDRVSCDAPVLATSLTDLPALKKPLSKLCPNCIAAYTPDLPQIAEYTVSGYGQHLNDRWSLVSPGICTNQDSKIVNDAFRSSAASPAVTPRPACST